MTAQEYVAIAKQADKMYYLRFMEKPGASGLLYVVDANGRPMLANRVHDGDLMWIETYNPADTENVTRALLASAVTTGRDDVPERRVFWAALGSDAHTELHATEAEARDTLLDALLAPALAHGDA